MRKAADVSLAAIKSAGNTEHTGELSKVKWVKVLYRDNNRQKMSSFTEFSQRLRLSHNSKHRPVDVQTDSSCSRSLRQSQRMDGLPLLAVSVHPDWQRDIT